MSELPKLIDLDKLKVPEDGTTIPYIYSKHTHWQPLRMTSILDYCRQNDQHRPNFMKQLRDSDKVRSFVKDVSEFTKEERSAYIELVNTYEETYKENYLDIFQSNFKYKEPVIVNLDTDYV